MLEVRNIEVPILVCPALGGNSKTNRQNDKNELTLPGAQLIEGKVLEGLSPQMEVANNT